MRSVRFSIIPAGSIRVRERPPGPKMFFNNSRKRVRRGFTLVEIVVAVFLLAMAVLMFGAFYPTAARTSRMSGNHSQAISEVQHKVDQLRAVGYGRLTYSELRAASIIDASPNASPFRFEAVDNVATLLPNPVGTITVASAGTDLSRVTVRISWSGAPSKAMEGSHEVTVLIANQ
jgi:prepilin-type N-terminal cleavage/methylation domain-containing protein